MIARGTSRIETDVQTAARRLVGHLRYLQYLPRRQGEYQADRWVFSATAGRVRPADMLAAVLAPGYLQVVLHTCILAPEVACDYRAWTRRFLTEQERQCLCWFGVLHAQDHHTDCPHVHVGLVKVPSASPRLLLSQRRSDQGERERARGQGGLLLPLPSLVKKESC